jgi:hypothetical protein
MKILSVLMLTFGLVTSSAHAQNKAVPPLKQPRVAVTIFQYEGEGVYCQSSKQNVRNYMLRSSSLPGDRDIVNGVVAAHENLAAALKMVKELVVSDAIKAKVKELTSKANGKISDVLFSVIQEKESAPYLLILVLNAYAGPADALRRTYYACGNNVNYYDGGSYAEEGALAFSHAYRGIYTLNPAEMSRALEESIKALNELIQVTPTGTELDGVS